VCVCHLKFIALYPCLLNFPLFFFLYPVLLVSVWCCSRLSSRLRRRRASTSGRSSSPARILSACLRSKLPSIGEGPGWLGYYALSLSLSLSLFLSLSLSFSLSLSLCLSFLAWRISNAISGSGLVKGWDGYALSLSLSLSLSVCLSLSLSLSLSFSLSLSLSLSLLSLSLNGQRQWSLRNTRSANMAALDHGTVSRVCFGWVLLCCKIAKMK
jgi:hypothetical protein